MVSGTTPVEMAVTDDDFHKLLEAIEALSHLQLTTLDAAIRGKLSAATAQLAAAAEAAEDAGIQAGDRASIADIETRFAHRTARIANPLRLPSGARPTASNAIAASPARRRSTR